MKIITRYACEICGKEYDLEAAALACEARGKPTYRFAVGDVVLAGAGFGWFDGDRRWVENYRRLHAAGIAPPSRGVGGHGNCFSSCCTYQFYYVVTALAVEDDDGHAPRYYVATKAMTGAQGYAGGWTTEETHVRLSKPIAIPEFVWRDSADLLGQRIEALL